MNDQRELAPGDTVELEIGDVAHGGVFVARHASGRVVFVSDALPGERVRVRITDVKKRFARGETLAVVTGSTERQTHIWAAASLDRDPEERAGGAEFGHMLPAYGRELKRRVLADALVRFGGLEADDPLVGDLFVEALPGDDLHRGTGWRTRMTLHIDDAGRVGPFAARSHRVVEVDDLPLAVADLAEFAMRQVRAGSGRGPGRLEFVAPSDHEVRMRTVFAGDAARDPEIITEQVHGHEFEVAESGFWQVHRFAATALFDAVRDLIDRDRFVADAANADLYGGVGLFAVALAEVGGRGTRVDSVEAAASATEFAARNLAAWEHASAHTGRVDRYLAEQLEGADARERSAFREATVVLDPPRAGAGGKVIDALAALEPQQVVYVACDPVALGRDTGLLRERGYHPMRMRALDLFPNTHHVETVAVFVRD